MALQRSTIPGTVPPATAGAPPPRPDAVPEPLLPSLGPLEDSIGFHLRLAHEASFHAIKQRIGETDLLPGRLAVLALIAENPGLTQTALSRVSGRDKSSVTTAIDDLERRGWVIRGRPANDRRSHALALTEAGHDALAAQMQHARQHENDLDRIVGKADRKKFLAILQRIITAFS